MELDVYAPCPCGSGKKLKFCCAGIVADMERIRRLLDDGQPRQALPLLEKLEKSQPDNTWVAGTLGHVFLQMADLPRAKEHYERMAKIHPDDAVILASLAFTDLMADGYEASRPVIYRAFQKAIPTVPTNVAMLAMCIGIKMEEDRRTMSARQHWTLSMRLSAEKDREQVFMLLLNLDGDREVAYPLRSVHNLTAPADPKKGGEEAKGHALAHIGCFAPAARAFSRTAERTPGNAAIWRNIALCRAWDGDERGAAEAFHRAAAESSDFDFAVECETLAQLCDVNTTEDAVPAVDVIFPIRSASRLLGVLGNNPRIFPADVADEPHEMPIAGSFVVTDKVAADGLDPETFAWDQLAVDAGQLLVLDANPEHHQGPQVLLAGHDDEVFNQTREFVQSLIAEELTGPAIESKQLSRSIPRQEMRYFRPCRFPPDLFRDHQADVIRRLEQLLPEAWIKAPQAALGNRSPLDAQGDPKLRLALTAAVYVLDSLAERRSLQFDLPAMLARLGLDLPRPLEITEDSAISALSSMQLHRIQPERLSDSQLFYVYRRALLIGHRRFVEAVSREILRRPQVLEQAGAELLFKRLVKDAQDSSRRVEAIEWAVQAREYVAKQPNSFQNVLSWTVTEFLMRMSNPDDPELPGLYRTLLQYYAPKVPEVAEMLDSIRNELGHRHPWMTTDLLVGSAAGGDSAGGLWTPGAATNAPASPRKLWLPGQR